MLKNYKNKSVESVKEKIKKDVKTLRCLKECNIPFVGAWKAGEEILDTKLVEKIGDNPNFEVLNKED